MNTTRNPIARATQATAILVSSACIVLATPWSAAARADPEGVTISVDISERAATPVLPTESNGVDNLLGLLPQTGDDTLPLLVAAVATAICGIVLAMWRPWRTPRGTWHDADE